MPELIKVDGVPDLARTLDRLDNGVRGRVSRNAAAAGMVPVNKAAKANIRKNQSIESGTLVKSIGVKKGTKGSASFAVVGPRVGTQYIGEFKGRIRKPWKYAHLVEFGTKAGGWRTKPTEAKPFAKPALKNNQRRVIMLVGQSYGRAFKRLRVTTSVS